LINRSTVSDVGRLIQTSPWISAGMNSGSTPLLTPCRLSPQDTSGSSLLTPRNFSSTLASFGFRQWIVMSNVYSACFRSEMGDFMDGIMIDSIQTQPQKTRMDKKVRTPPQDVGS
jgi:hypothetical protein